MNLGRMLHKYTSTDVPDYQHSTVTAKCSTLHRKNNFVGYKARRDNIHCVVHIVHTLTNSFHGSGSCVNEHSYKYERKYKFAAILFYVL
jgi:hypothetical protein